MRNQNHTGSRSAHKFAQQENWLRVTHIMMLLLCFGWCERWASSVELERHNNICPYNIIYKNRFVVWQRSPGHTHIDVMLAAAAVAAACSNIIYFISFFPPIWILCNMGEYWTPIRKNSLSFGNFKWTDKPKNNAMKRRSTSRTFSIWVIFKIKLELIVLVWVDSRGNWNFSTSFNLKYFCHMCIVQEKHLDRM